MKRNKPNIFSHWNKNVRLDTSTFRGGLFQRLYKSEKDYLFHRKTNQYYNVQNYFTKEIRNEPIYIELFTKLLENSVKYAKLDKKNKLTPTKIIKEAKDFLKYSKIPQFERMINSPLFYQFKEELKNLYQPHHNIKKYTDSKIYKIKKDEQITYNYQKLSKEETQFAKTLYNFSKNSKKDNVSINFTSGSTLLFSTQNTFHDETFTRLTPTIIDNVKDIMKLIKDNKIQNADFITIDVNIDREEFLKRLDKFEIANKEFGDPWFSLNAVFNKGYHTEEYSIPELGLRMTVSNADSEQVTSYVEQFSFNESQFNENFPSLVTWFKLESLYRQERFEAEQSFNYYNPREPFEFYKIMDWIKEEWQSRQPGGLYDKLKEAFGNLQEKLQPNPNPILGIETIQGVKNEVLQEFLDSDGGNADAFKDKIMEELQRFKGLLNKYPIIDKLYDKYRNGLIKNLPLSGELFFRMYEKSKGIFNEPIID